MICYTINLTTIYTDLNVTESNRILPNQVCGVNKNSKKWVYNPNVVFSCAYDTYWTLTEGLVKFYKTWSDHKQLTVKSELFSFNKIWKNLKALVVILLYSLLKVKQKESMAS